MQIKKIPEWKLATDGACSGNPGPGGFAFILQSPDGQVQEGGAHEPETTNNRMEMRAVLDGLRAIRAQKENAAPPIPVHLILDSSYVLRGLTEGYKRPENWAKNQDLWQELWNLRPQFKIRGELVRGHQGIAINERADEIAVGFSKGIPPDLYHGPADRYPVSFDTQPFQPFYLCFLNGKLSRYKTWPECESVVRGTKAKFKKIQSIHELDQTLGSWGASELKTALMEGER